MPENEKQADVQSAERPKQRDEYRSLATDIAAVAAPVAVVAAPVVNAWAKKHFTQDDKPQPEDPQPQQPSKDA
jgi:hypothetical protein